LKKNKLLAGSKIKKMLTKVIFFTLIHSLWIGLLAAILCGIVLVCTKKTAPNIRYNLLSAGLILFTLLTAGAGIYEYNAAATMVNCPTILRT